MFSGFECVICGSWSFDGDLQAHICLNCIDMLYDWGDFLD